MESINCTCQGAGHIAKGKVCQDYSYSHAYEDGSAIAIVCDGHGGERYFRSDVGAKFAAEIAEQKVLAFLEAVSPMLERKGFTQRSAISTQIENQDFEKLSPVERAFRQLFASIIFEWNTRVAIHAEDHPILEAEKPGLQEKWIKEFSEGQNLEKVYGCTLIVYVCTPAVWLAFQIGDGKCFELNDSGEWRAPIPWDERCFLNKTTSICDSGAIDEFRYCFCGDGTFPAAMILGSDGIDDSLGEESNQENFYVQILKSLVTVGIEATAEELNVTLPQLSKIGSQDDMSISMVFNTDELKRLYPKLIEWQIANVNRQISEEEAKIEKSRKTTDAILKIKRPTQSDLIDLRYAQSEEKRALESRERLALRLSTLQNELPATSLKDIESNGDV